MKPLTFSDIFFILSTYTIVRIFLLRRKSSNFNEIQLKYRDFAFVNFKLIKIAATT